MLPKLLMTVSSLVFLTLGTVHLVYTFSGTKLEPRDAELKVRMEAISPNVSGETTMWRAWLGFNASHSAGLIFFGLVYAYLAIFQTDVLFRSPFLLALGLAVIVAFVVLSKLYFFSVPFWGVLFGLFCYIGSVGLSRALK
jgi:hypothetical protein